MRRLLSLLLLMLLIFESLAVSSEHSNLISNGGFESGKQNWTFSASGASIVTTQKRSGAYSLHLIGEDDSLNPYAWTALSTNIYEYAKYKVSGYVKFEQPPSKGAAIKFEFRHWNGNHPVHLNLQSVAADMNTAYINANGNEWTYFEEEFVMPEGCNYLKPYFRMYGSGSIFYDDVAFEMIEPPPAMKIISDSVYYYTEWDTGTLTAKITEPFSKTFEGKSVVFTIYDGDKPLVSYSSIIENDMAKCTFDISVLKDIGKEYTAVCVLKDNNSEISVSKTDIYRYDRPKNIDENGRYIVKGEVFNPVLAYHVYPYQYPLCKEIGVNVVQVFLSRTATPEQLNKQLNDIASHGLKALVALYYDGKAAGSDANAKITERIVSAVAENDAVFAYAVLDEPPITAEEDLKKSYKLIRDNDSKHPVYAVECLSSLFPMVEKYVDILACDPYPGFSGSGENPISDFPGRDTRLAYQAAKGRKPILSVLQLVEYNDYDPIYDEVRHALYQVVSSGASYIGFYPMFEPYGFLLEKSKLWDGLKKMAKYDLPLVFEYINEGTKVVSKRKSRYTLQVWDIKSEQYLIAISNSDTNSVALSFPLEGRKPAADYNTKLSGYGISGDSLNITLSPKELKVFKLITSDLYATQSGKTINSIRPEGIKIVYDNPTNSDTLIVTSYKIVDGNLCLAHVKVKKQNIDENLYIEIEDNDTAKIRAFVWDGVGSMTPKTKVLELENVQ